MRDVYWIPPCDVFDQSISLEQFFDKHVTDENKELFFPYLLLRGNLGHCTIFVSADTAEITPPFLPSLTLPAFGAKNIVRVFLSATLETRADFARAFGRFPDLIIVPDVDAGNGERLVLFSSGFAEDVAKVQLVEKIAKKHKVLISVPSARVAQAWDPIVKPPATDKFSEALNKFRNDKHGTFLLVGRYDGIDLPGATCRIMAIEGLPAGTTLLERYQHAYLTMDHFFAGIIANRVVQLFGRINRGRQDYAVFLILDKALENWLKNRRNIALFPSLLRRQTFLGEQIQKQWGQALDAKDILGTIDNVLQRNPEWIQFYKSHISDQDISQDEQDEVTAEEKLHEAYARAEVVYMTKIWESDMAGARAELEESISALSVIDPALAGWYCIWIGMSFYYQGNRDAAVDYFENARRRIGKPLPLPRAELTPDAAKKFEPSVVGNGFAAFCQGDVIAINDRLAKTKKEAANFFSPTATHKQAEESLRVIGAALGFDSSRPCTEFGAGPDNLWLDPFKNLVIAFELKTEKSADAALSKEDVGQGHNHLQWIAEHYPDHKLIGLIYISKCGDVSSKANPSPMMSHGTPDAVQVLWDQFLAAIEKIRNLTVLERIAEAGKRGELPEWSAEGIFARLQKKKLTS